MRERRRHERGSTWRMRQSTPWRCCFTRCKHSSRTASRHFDLSWADRGVRLARDMHPRRRASLSQICEHQALEYSTEASDACWDKTGMLGWRTNACVRCCCKAQLP